MKLSFFILVFMLIGFMTSAQSLKGIVVDENLASIEGVVIFNKTTNESAYSNTEGEFDFEKVSIGDILHFYHVSYSSKIVIVSDIKTPLQVILDSETINLDAIVISPKVEVIKRITAIDIQTNPVNSSQDVLRKIPGLFIGQHAGGGKAEQLFLRGFDVDHGTDVSVAVDGLPVNMVSHAHGQGYADLHFVIPETINKIDFGKGPYYEDQGNFNTAGYVDFKTKEKLDNSLIKAEVGQFDTYRLLGMFDLINDTDRSAYFATEYLSTDGPFISPQNFNRINLFGKYTAYLSDTDKFSITGSHFTSEWDASGQIPQRAVDSGLISRFGAIDDTEGGVTSRTNVMINHKKIIDDNSSISSSAFYSKYDFELYSNFTFFLEDPINGDQIKQKDDRTIYGFNSEYKKSFSKNKLEGSWQAGISLRNDQTDDTELSHTLNRSETLEFLMLGDIHETNYGAYLGANLELGKWSFNPSLRVDHFEFQYNDDLQLAYETQEAAKSTISPKFNFVYTQSDRLQLYVKTGKGFHSNDTRVVIAEQEENTLSSAYGVDVGYIWKPASNMFINMAFWYLYLEQEFVYVGDAGIVEPSGQTRRQGIELSYRYQPLPWIYWNLDANYTFARSIDEPSGQDYIPLAPIFTLVSGVNVKHDLGLYGGVNFRLLGDRAANEDNSIVAEGYGVTDLNLGYKWNRFNFGIQIQNLFDVEWNETQFATETRLLNEIDPVEEIHFTPGTPFFIKSTIEYNF